ncbi:MAG: hypothetical protein UY04_C0037G0003 [Parcubacteria group bacterium GW2011_GWA2_47_7]|nr:MAG: hypothetical protein UY04_C0037G0003 [Parcubacteria group bacterium GW2011_GWA2_47_7]
MGKQESQTELRIETIPRYNWGGLLGVTETHFDKFDRVVFEKSVNASTGAVNTVEYAYVEYSLAGETRTDRNGKIIQYRYEKMGAGHQ